MDESSIDGDTRAALEFIRALVDDRVIRDPMDYQATALADDFARQLTSGTLPYQGHWVEPYDAKRKEIDVDALRRRAEARFGPSDVPPDELRERGKPTHPDFEEWVRVNWE